MKCADNCLIILAITCFTLFSPERLLAQQAGTGATKIQPQALLLRQVSGIVQDSTGTGIAGVTIKLISTKDSVLTATDKNGIFVFEEVKMATFIITVTGVGLKTKVNRFLNNDQAPKIVLSPIMLEEQTYRLKEVNINGTPSIIYKTDTVEYRASDYKVRVHATVDELLKKMEGMEVGNDGTLTYQGQQVKKANLNGKAFAGGAVAQAITTLPANIIEKVQIVDDYGEQASRTGIKNGAPTKTLNLTTKADKSIGTFGSLTAQAGNDRRYNTQLNVSHIDANQQLNFIGQFNNIITGVARGVNGNTAGSPGTLKTNASSFSYRDQWSKNVQINASYTYNFTDNTAVNKSFGEVYSYGQNSLVKNTSSVTSQSTSENKNKSHNTSIEVDYNIGKFDYLQVTPTFIYTNSRVANSGLTDNLNNFTTGFEHQVLNSTIHNQNTNTGAGINALYKHLFKNPKRNFSAQISINRNNQSAAGDKLTDYSYYTDSTRKALIKDSTAHLLIKRTNINTSYNTTISYVEPVNSFAELQFEGKVNRNVYDNNAIADTVLIDGRLVELTRLENIYHYSFTETRAAISYAYHKTKLNFSLGVSAVPTYLAGTKANQSTNENISTSFNNFRIIPVFSLGYKRSQTERFALSYSGTNIIPDFQQIQPFTDRSDPNNIIIGNPDLKAAFTNTITASYNKYIANSRINYGLNINAAKFQDQVVTNIIQLAELISTSPDRYKTIYETHYNNLSGSKSVFANYTISKQLADRRYNFSLNGFISYGYNLAMSNNATYHNKSWRFNERFGPKINPTDNFEINPYVAYELSKTTTSLAGASPTLVSTTSLAVDSKIYFLKSWQLNYSISKSFVSGLGNLNTNPLVINSGFQKEFLERKILVLTFNVYDLLHQNNFIRQTVTPQGVTNTLSNTLSRYFLIGLRLNLQKWGGTPKRSGKELKRKGDGSFIY